MHDDDDINAPEAPPLAPGWTDGDVAMLERLADLGIEMAQALTASAVQYAKEQPAGARGAAAFAKAFDQVARSVRLTLSLKAHVRSGAAHFAGSSVVFRRAPSPSHETQQAAEAVADAFTGPGTESRIERERGERPEREYEIFVGGREIALERICRDLGLACEWVDDPTEPGVRRLHISVPAGHKYLPADDPDRPSGRWIRPPALAG